MNKSRKQSNQKDFNSLMDAYKKDYIQSAGERLTELDTLLEELTGNPDNPAACKRMRQIVHNLSGSAGLYGMTLAGDAARSIDQRMLDITEQGQTINPDDLARFRQALDIIRNEFRIGKPPPSATEPEAAAVVETGIPTPADAPQPRRILVIEDDADVSRLIGEHLRRAGYHVTLAATGKAALHSLASDIVHDLILLDLMLPDIDGYALLKAIREDRGKLMVPIIILTARNATNDKVEGLERGADDYVTKPCVMEELLARVATQLERTSIFKELALKDGLTGAFNHRHFQERLSEEIRRWERRRHTFCMCMMDLDRFKAVNDTYGHQVGDVVLQGLVEYLRIQLRGLDILARYGGEEFTVIFPETGLEAGRRAMTRLFQNMRPLNINLPDGGTSLLTTFSAGLVECPRDGTDARTLIHKADRALYYAKHQGGNCYYCYQDLPSSFALHDAAPIQPDVPAKPTVYYVGPPGAVREHFIPMLRKEGYQVTTLEDLHECLVLAQERIPNLMILDHGQDGIGGILDDTASISRLPDLAPTLIVAGRSQDLELDPYLRCGIVDFMIQPFNLAEVRLRLRRAQAINQTPTNSLKRGRSGEAPPPA